MDARGGREKAELTQDVGVEPIPIDFGEADAGAEGVYAEVVAGDVELLLGDQVVCDGVVSTATNGGGWGPVGSEE